MTSTNRQEWTKSIRVRDTVIEKDGTVVKTFANGMVIKQLLDGTKIQKTPDNVQVIQYTDGRIVQTYPEGTTIEQLVDKTKIQTNPDGSTVTMKPDGSIIRKGKNQDGTTVIITTLSDGTKIQEASNVVTRFEADGSVHQTNADGTEISMSATGVKTIKRRDGNTVIVDSNGIVDGEADHVDDAEFPNLQHPSTTLRVFDDGTQIQECSTGNWKWIMKKPNGTTIQKGFDGKTFVSLRSGEMVIHDPHRSRQITVVTQGNPANVMELDNDPTRVELDNISCKHLKRSYDTYETLKSRFDATLAAHHRFEYEKKLMDLEKQHVARMQSADHTIASITTKLHQEQKVSRTLREQVSVLESELEEQKKLQSKLSKKLLQMGIDLEKAKSQIPPPPPQMQSTGIQFSASDIPSIKCARPWRESQSEFSNPETNRFVIENLRRSVTQLEKEKEEVEDKLIDLKLSITPNPACNRLQEQKKGLFSRLLCGSKPTKAPIIQTKASPKTGSFTSGPLTSKGSFYLALERFKERDISNVKRVTELEAKLTELQKEKTKLDNDQTTWLKEKSDMESAIQSLQLQLDTALEAAVAVDEIASRFSGIDDISSMASSDSNPMLDMMPYIDDAPSTENFGASMYSVFSLSDVSPMI